VSLGLVERRPVSVSAAVSIAAGGSGTATVNVPGGERYFIKQLNITKGANITVTAQTIDGAETAQAASYDCEATFGALLTAEGSITVSGSNAGVGAESLTVQAIGVSVGL
jgi:hypothetical protein